MSLTSVYFEAGGRTNCTCAILVDRERFEMASVKQL
jgi:hypothetical protein